MTSDRELEGCWNATALSLEFAAANGRRAVAWTGNRIAVAEYRQGSAAYRHRIHPGHPDDRDPTDLLGGHLGRIPNGRECTRAGARRRGCVRVVLRRYAVCGTDRAWVERRAASWPWRRSGADRESGEQPRAVRRLDQIPA